MSLQLMLASAAITLALVFYTIGVFSERHDEHLSKNHVILFWCGLVFDTTGTTIMTSMAQAGSAGMTGIHGITGAAAIVLMLFHAVWATFTLVRRNRNLEQTFHRFSTVVWLVWLVPYIIGMFAGIPFIALSDGATVGISVGIVAVIALVLAWSSKRKASAA